MLYMDPEAPVFHPLITVKHELVLFYEALVRDLHEVVSGLFVL